MDRPQQTSDTPPGERTQTLRGKDEATAPTIAARGTPTWNEHTRTQATQLPIDDPDRYQLVGEHARGGLGRVVRAVDTRLGRTVAVKELLKQSGTAEALFVREALITARLQHPGIVPVIEAGRWPNGEPYYVMKLVEGRSLKELIGGRKSLAQRIALLPHVIAVSEAVGYAHSQDVIHRDVKPANVVVGEFGETVVVDWGLARDGHRADSATLDAELTKGAPPSGEETVSGRVIGTPQYMAPEQARGEIVDARADVYALGALLYEVLAGVAPFAGGDADAILERVVAGPPRPLAEAQSGVPDDLLAIVEKAMSRERDLRYPTAKELAEDLKRFATGQLVTAHEYGTIQLFRRWISRHRGVVAVAAIGALITVIVAIGMIRRILEERNDARRERGRAEIARGAAEDRSNALRALQAESSVRRDPTAAVAWLKQYRIDADNAGDAATILEEALASGTARHVLRQDDWVYGVAFSPDGNSLATASKDGHVRLFDVTTGQARSLGDHAGGVMTTAFVEEGKALLTGGLDGTVLLWPVAGGPPRPIGSVRGGVKELRITHDQVLQVWSEDNDYAAWQLPSGELIVHLGDESILTGMQASDVSPLDGATWLVAYSDGRLGILDHGVPKTQLPKLALPARMVRFAPDGLRAAVYDGASVAVIDLATGTSHTLGKLEGPARWITWSHDGTQVAAGGEMTDFVLYATDPAHPSAKVMRGHVDSIYGATYSRDGKRLLTASDDGTARVWDLVTGGVEVLRGHEDDVYQAVFSPDETMVATASLDSTARMWRIGASGVRVLGGDADTIFVLRELAGGDLVSVSSPLRILRWDLATGEREVVVSRADDVYKTLPAAISTSGTCGYTPDASGAIEIVLTDGKHVTLTGHTAPVAGGGFATDGDLVSASHDGTVRKWNVTTGESTLIEVGNLGPIGLAAMAPSGDRFALMHDGVVSVHGLDGALIGKMPLDNLPDIPKLWRVVFSPTGEDVVVTGPVHMARWTPATNTIIPLEQIGHRATNVGWSPDGKLLGGAMADRTVRVWNTATGALVQTFRGHTDLVMNVAFSPDGSQLASTSYDRTIRIWDLATEQSRILRGHAASVEVVVWLDGGKRLATAGRDGTVRIWPAPSTETPSPDELRRQLDRATTAVIGPSERLGTPSR